MTSELSHYSNKDILVKTGRDFLWMHQSDPLLQKTVDQLVNTALPALLKNPSLKEGNFYSPSKTCFSPTESSALPDLIKITDTNFAEVGTHFIASTVFQTFSNIKKYTWHADGIACFAAYKISIDLNLTEGLCWGYANSLIKALNKVQKGTLLAPGYKQAKHGPAQSLAVRIANKASIFPLERYFRFQNEHQRLLNEIDAFEKLPVIDRSALTQDRSFTSSLISESTKLPPGDNRTKLFMFYSKLHTPALAQYDLSIPLSLISSFPDSQLGTNLKALKDTLANIIDYERENERIQKMKAKAAHVEVRMKAVNPFPAPSQPAPSQPQPISPFPAQPQPAPAQPQLAPLQPQPIFPLPAQAPSGGPGIPLAQRRVTQRNGCMRCLLSLLASIRSIWNRLFRC